MANAKNIRESGRAPAGKQKLGPVLSARLVQKHKSLKEAANVLGLEYDILRQDLSKSRFAEPDLVKMCNELGLPGREKLEEAYFFEMKKPARGAGRAKMEWENVKTLSTVFKLVDKEMGRVRRLVGIASEIIPKLLGSLGSGDMLVVFISDEMPNHWSGNVARRLLPAVAGALGRGTMMAYLHPSTGLVDFFEKCGWAGLKRPAEVRSQFEVFKDSLAVLVKEDGHLENLIVVEHDAPFVCVPQHRYVLYLHSDKGHQEAWATGTYPVHYVAAEAETSPFYLVVPLNRRFRDVLQDVLLRSLSKKMRADKGKLEEGKDRRFLEKLYFMDGAGENEQSD